MTLELRRRVGFTIGALLVYRFGTYIPVPGIDSSVLAALFRSQAGGLLSGFDLFSGGAVGRLAIFALGITPYLSAAIIVQILTVVVPRLKALKRRGEQGRATINAYTLYLTVLLTAFQAYGLAVALESIPGGVPDPGTMFRISTVLTLAGGTMFLVWLTEQISVRGIGNGIALVLALGIVMELPATIGGTLEIGRQGMLSTDAILGLIVLTVVLTALIVVMEGAQRRLWVEFPARPIGARTIEGRSFLRIKLNNAGILPTIFASWLLLLPVLIVRSSADQLGWWGAVADEIAERGRYYLTGYAFLIVVCAFVYTALIFNPDVAAEDLRKYGGVVPGVEPGDSTAVHIDHVLTRITVLGAAYLALVYLVPELLIAYAQVPFYLGGASLLIVVCAILDLQTQVQGYATIKSGG